MSCNKLLKTFVPSNEQNKNGNYYVPVSVFTGYIPYRSFSTFGPYYPECVWSDDIDVVKINPSYAMYGNFSPIFKITR